MYKKKTKQELVVRFHFFVAVSGFGATTFRLVPAFPACANTWKSAILEGVYVKIHNTVNPFYWGTNILIIFQKG